MPYKETELTFLLKYRPDELRERLLDVFKRKRGIAEKIYEELDISSETWFKYVRQLDITEEIWKLRTHFRTEVQRRAAMPTTTPPKGYRRR